MKKRKAQEKGIRKKGPPPKAKAQKKAGKQREEDELHDDLFENASEEEIFMDDDQRKKKPAAAVAEEEEVDPEAGETADEKRVRLAKEYLQKFDLEKEELTSDDEGKADEEEDYVANRLRQDVAKSRGKLLRNVASRLGSHLDSHPAEVRVLKGHRLPVTCIALSNDDATIFSGSKDQTIMRWDMETGQKTLVNGGVSKSANKETKMGGGHTDHVLALSASDDGRYLASGGRDRVIKIWDLRTNQVAKAFPAHRDAVSSLAFRKDSLTLYSGSFDRTVKVWNLDVMGYVETLFGHQAEITDMECHWEERPLTCSKDKSVRWWKVADESQLVFGSTHTAPIDCVGMLSTERFISGSQDGALALWLSKKRKANHIVRNAHDGHWITSATALPASDLCASGSSDGLVRLWKAGTQGTETNKLLPVGTVPIVGVINAMKFTGTGKHLVCAVGQEHRFGRWVKVQQGKNSVQIVKLTDEHIDSAPATITTDRDSNLKLSHNVTVDDDQDDDEK